MNIEFILHKMESALLGKPLMKIGRVADMLWIVFGKELQDADFRGRIRAFNEYSLHVQCPFHFILNEELILGSYDVYLPKDGIARENFEWDIQGNNLYDQQAIQLNENVFPLMVEEISLDETGTLRIRLQKKAIIEVFPNGNMKQEYWRFFSHGGEHFVIMESESQKT